MVLALATLGSLKRSKSAILPICRTAWVLIPSPRGQRVNAIEEFGAGDGNRTHVRSLGSSCSTIELHPQAWVLLAFAFL